LPGVLFDDFFVFFGGLNVPLFKPFFYVFVHEIFGLGSEDEVLFLNDEL
jgi:hypothetical protein